MLLAKVSFFIFAIKVAGPALSAFIIDFLMLVSVFAFIIFLIFILIKQYNVSFSNLIFVYDLICP